MRRTPKQPRRSSNERDEEPVEHDNLERPAARVPQPGDPRDDGDQRLRARGRALSALSHGGERTRNAPMIPTASTPTYIRIVQHHSPHMDLIRPKFL